MTTDNPHSTLSDASAQLRSFQDGFITRRLPGWLKKLDPARFALLSEALHAGLATRRQLSAIFSRVQNIDEFAKQRIVDRFGLSTAPDKLFLRQWYTYASPTVHWATSRLPIQDRDWYDISLLWAALQNFSYDHITMKGDCVVDMVGNTDAQLSATAFVQACRSLDIGAQYQKHLQSVLKSPGESGANGQGFAELLQRQIRSMMLVDALKAHSDGVLSEVQLEWVIDVYRQGLPGRLAGAPVVARKLQILGCELQQIVVFDVIDEGFFRNTSKAVLVYIPADPQGPWSVSNDLETFARRVLGRRLRDEQYRKFFSRFVRRRDSQHFFSEVQKRLGDIADFATRDLDQHMTRDLDSLFQGLAIGRIRQIMDDASMIAVPVAQVDAAAQAEHDRRMAAEGWAGLTLASLFVPQLGVILLAVMAWDLLDETFQAVADWREGDDAAALDHLLNVGKSLAMVAAVGAAGATMRHVWQRAVMVDDMVPAVLEDGNEKLWNQDLAPYVSQPPPVTAVVDAQGIYRQDVHSWIEMDGDYYQVSERVDGEWYLRPHANHSPQLEHNGAGAWRLWSERPEQWSDTQRMFSRLGSQCARLPRSLVDHVIAVHGLSDLHLRALHVFGQAPEVELIDTVNRFLMAERVADLQRCLRSGEQIADQPLLLKALELPGSAGLADDGLAQVVADHRRQLFQMLYDPLDIMDETTRPLRRAFASLHQLAAKQMVEEASEAQRIQMADSGRVPLAMALAARERVLRIRVARVGEGLWIDVPQTFDFARAVLKLLQGLPGVPADKSWHLIDAQGRLAFPATSSQHTGSNLLYQDGAFWLRDAQGNDESSPGELFETLADTFSTVERAAMGLEEPFAISLRQAVARQWVTGRQGIEKLFGGDHPTAPFLLPRRLDDGRIGYPLSGGGRLFGSRPPAALPARLRTLCAGASDEQIEAWLSAAGPENAETAIREFESQLKVLKTSLTRWQRLGAFKLEWLARYGFRKTLIARWRVSILGKFLDLKVPSALWDIGMGFQQLPELPESIVFPHVTQFALRDSELTEIPEKFFRAFPNLQELDLTNGEIRNISLPPFLRGQLRSLDLSGNRIKLDARQVEVLESCTALLYLNLSNNPLKVGFSISGMPELRSLLLRSTRLPGMPGGVLRHQKLSRLELTDSTITSFDPDFWASPIVRRGRFRVGMRGETVRRWYDPESILNPVPQRYQWEDAVDLEFRDDLASLWQSIEELPGSHNFFDLLKRLSTSAEFASDNGANELAYRVQEMMEAIKEAGDSLVITEDELATIVENKLAQETGLNAGRERLMADTREQYSFRADFFRESEVNACGDDALSHFIDLEMKIQTWRLIRNPEAHSEAELLRVGGQFWRMQKLDEFSSMHAFSLGMAAKSVDVQLMYRIELYDDLQLPIRRPVMRFTGEFDRRAVDRPGVLRDIREHQVVAEMAPWFCEQAYWRKYLEQTSPARFKLPAQRIIEKNRLHEADDAEGMEAFNKWEADWLHDQRMALTEAAMQRAAYMWNVNITE
ncbi:dermonecrotic toxin domain-containing protein [Pseudomonas alloputida]|uniref:dermonecrotic toxin domain-containing protein n=1 Tax=Pseudomonas TaxID=286 RepID=UPI003EE831E8